MKNFKPYKKKFQVAKIRKSTLQLNLDSRTVLTDDIFSYVKYFFLLKNKKTIIVNNGEKVDNEEHIYNFYWEQAENFYKLTKQSSIESSALPMYYCMLNAAKAFISYKVDNFDVSKTSHHGLIEGKCEKVEVEKIRKNNS